MSLWKSDQSATWGRQKLLRQAHQRKLAGKPLTKAQEQLAKELGIKDPTKYNSKSKMYNGVSYQSQMEAGYAAELDLRIRVGEVKSWKRQVKIPLDINGRPWISHANGEVGVEDGTHIASYFMDFVVHMKDGIYEYVEVKGLELETWRLKYRLFEGIYGELFKRHGWIMRVVK